MKKYISMQDFFKDQSRSKKKKSKVLKFGLYLICLSLVIFPFGVLVKWSLDNFEIRRINKEIRKSIIINKNKSNDKMINLENLSFYQVNFSNLLQQNNDTIAFIHMDSTNIDYPVVQINNNTYYLNHAFDKSKNKAGWVFMDYRNNIDNLSDNTIIYGHSRLDGTMFGSLRSTLTSYWQKDKANYVIYLSTLKENMIFQIFSIYSIKSESYYITTSFKNDKEKEKWIKTMKKRNISPVDVEVTSKDKFLTLSTCKNNRGQRIVIQAKLIKKQKR